MDSLLNSSQRPPLTILNNRIKKSTNNYMDYPERNALRTILDFVERWNKNDADEQVAEAANNLEIWLQKVENDINKVI